MSAGNAGDAFSAQAPSFDDMDHANPIITWMRGRVHGIHDRYIRANDQVLEVAGGTGIDALRMAARGARVTATDIAPGMITEMHAKVANAGLSERVEVIRMDVHDLSPIGGRIFDHVTSNFGGLNCSDRLPEVVRSLALHVRQGGTLILVVMPPYCLWELASFAKRGLGSAARRWKSTGALSDVEGTTFTTWYYTPSDLVGAVTDLCDIMECRPLGLCCPPPHHGPRAVQFPAPYRALMLLDDAMARWAWQASFADHYMLVLRRSSPHLVYT